METKSLFKSTEESPYHLSVGAVLVNAEGKIGGHYFKTLFARDEKRELNDFYILMRETVEVGESIEGAVLRGIQEEFMATGKIERFLGTLVTKFPRGNTWIEKTTLYFLVKLENINGTERNPNDAESVSILEWQPIDFLISKMEEQKKRYERTDLDESEILKRAQKYIQVKPV